MTDTSKQYIKMCDHPLIRDNWVIKQYDRTDKGVVAGFSYTKDKTILIVTIKGQYHKNEMIWKPRQDDWQGMLNRDGITKLISDFSIYACLAVYRHRDSMEQYLKWTGTDWINA